MFNWPLNIDNSPLSFHLYNQRPIENVNCVDTCHNSKTFNVGFKGEPNRLSDSPLALIILIYSLYSFQEHAFESSQKYKEGKFIIELAHMVKENGWD